MPKDSLLINYCYSLQDTQQGKPLHNAVAVYYNNLHQGKHLPLTQHGHYILSEFSLGNDAYILFLVVLTGLVFGKKIKEKSKFSSWLKGDNTNDISEAGTGGPLVYYGKDLNFSELVYRQILSRHFPFYQGLNDANKNVFITRLKKFISQKVFIIHDTSGYREMPVLISATAIQLTFGLQKYLLPNFEYIHIFPEEFVGVYPVLRVLEGNVSGNTINLSWKHFLAGFKTTNNGQNVGLHEMAHAYYYQFFETGQQVDNNFVNAFPAFNNYGNKVFVQERKAGYNLYSDYAFKNFQEFWAESVEIFFEKPQEMKAQYPELYATLCEILNQQPAESLVFKN